MAMSEVLALQEAPASIRGAGRRAPQLTKLLAYKAVELSMVGVPERGVDRYLRIAQHSIKSVEDVEEGPMSQGEVIHWLQQRGAKGLANRLRREFAIRVPTRT